MKRKILSIIVLAMLILPLFVSCYSVKAFNGELETEGYINFGDVHINEEHIGTTTLSLSSAVSNYEMYYQKIDINKSKYDSLKAKVEAYNSYVEEAQRTLAEKRAVKEDLRSQYDELLNSGTATDEQKATLRAQYETANAEYEEYANNAETEKERLRTAYISEIPDYTDAWQKAEKTTNNVTLDFKNSAGTISFVLWAKITNGTNTYYNAKFYSTVLHESTTPEVVSGGRHFKLINNGGNVWLEVKGIEKLEGVAYSIYISDNSNKPNVSNLSSDDFIRLGYYEEEGLWIAEDLARYVELSQDLYVNVIKETYENGNEILSIEGEPVKLNRFDVPKYTDAFYATFLTYNKTQIITNFVHSPENKRKMQIKIGKITDKAILQKIKNKDTSGFADLQNYAKSNEAIYNQTVDADGGYSMHVEYVRDNEGLKLSGLEDEAYYYLYVKTDEGENKEYISNEAVTLAQVDTFNDGSWYMFFYGDVDFKWADFGNGGSTTDTPKEEGDAPKKDDTETTKVLPHTGIGYAVFIALGIVTVVSVISGKKYKWYNFK